MSKTTTRRTDEEAAETSRGEAPAPPVPIKPPAPMTPAWASAVGNQAVARMAAEQAQQDQPEVAGAEEADLDAFDPSAVIEATLAAVGEEAEGEVGDAEAAVATVARSPLARDKSRKTATPRKVPLTAGDVVDVKRVGTRTIREFAKLEQERAITTAEAETWTERTQAVIDRAEKGKGDRAVLARNLDKMRKLPDHFRKRAAAGRSTKGKKLISDFKVEPPVVKVSEHESARISFVLKDDAKSVSAFILSDPDREGTSYRFFNIDATAGYHQVIWDGTFEGTRNRPPRPGTYRIEIGVLGADGKSETVVEQIRVENPDDETMLPRVGSGLAVSTLTFDGSTLILTDDGGNTIEVPATSGLKPNNPKNKEKEDYTTAEHQWAKGKGPIPAGSYMLKPSQYQLPNAGAKGVKYPSGGTAAKWGPMRIQILPNRVKNRSEFFLHMDVSNDGTAGCIGVPPGQEGKFNQIMSLIATNPKDVKLHVGY
ncbi:MAG: hypothetical protein ABW060_04885 [Solirubrobacteraceae bacterium]